MTRAAPLALVPALLLAACARGVHAAVVYNFSVPGFLNGTAGFVYAGAGAFYDLRPDACGVCGGNNSSCTGCDGVPLSGKAVDACGVCTRNCTPSPDDPTCTFQPVCPDCAGVVNGDHDTLGACGGCRSRSDPLYGTVGVPNYQLGGCVGCDGVPFSGATLDACRVCLLPGAPGVNASCTGCDGVPNSGAVYDACCECRGNATVSSACYQALMAAPDEFVSEPFNPNSAAYTYASYYSALGRARYDECGECRGWGYAGAECAGCDGVPMSGKLLDPCGVCGGNCSCDAGTAAAGASCIAGSNASALCQLVQTTGPGASGTPLYPATPRNRPGLLRWTDTANGTCIRPDVPPPAPPAAEWIVLLNGTEFGPYTLAQLRTGFISVTDTQTMLNTSILLTPKTLIGRVTTTLKQRNITYGETSALLGRAASWAAAAATKTGVVSSPSTTSTPNVVVLTENETSLINFTDASGAPTLRYSPLGRIPQLIGVAYPPCSGITWRNGRQRTHGKRTGLNQMGIIVSNNITSFDGLQNQSWNPWMEFIYDVADAWEDQTCVCHDDWIYTPEAVPPTCARSWGTWERWLADSRIYADAAPAPYALDVQRSAVGGTMRASGGPGGSGGLWIADAGGIGAARLGAEQESLLGVYGGTSTRGPWRITSRGTLSLVTTKPLPGAPRCSPSARVVPPVPGAAGALWYTGARVSLGANISTTLRFVLSAPAQRCTDVRQLSRSYSEEIRTRLHTTCTTLPGDGFALVLMDAPATPNAATLGAGGGSLGYAGLRNSLAVEFDTLGDPSLGEPAMPHVAVVSRGTEPNDAAHQYALGSTTAVPAFADGLEHVAHVTFSPQVPPATLAAALNSTSWRGGGAQLASMLSAGSIGVLKVYLDDMVKPVLTVPLAPAFFLRNGSATGTAWLGLTASTGGVWQAVDVLQWNASATR